MYTTVMIDVFSGLPNPTWRLTPELSEDLARRLRHLPSIDGPHRAPPDLGYRGIVFQDDKGGQSSLRLFGGILSRQERALSKDPGRKLELWLLTLSAAHVDADLLEELKAEIAASP